MVYRRARQVESIEYAKAVTSSIIHFRLERADPHERRPIGLVSGVKVIEAKHLGGCLNHPA
jgi:hypothetical protein